MGLTDKEALLKQKNGESNDSFGIKTKSVPEILRDNLISLFNLVNIILAISLILVGSYRNILFMGVVLSNIAIGTFQEIRSKLTIDRLSVLTAPKAHVIRSGKEKSVPTGEIVTDDVMVLSGGDQVCADAEILEGECETDESLVTGESDPISKHTGDELLSGSFIISGYVKAKAVRVGENSVSGKIMKQSKFVKKRDSEMLKAVNSIVKIVSVCIIPFGAILFIKSLLFTDQGLQSSVTTTAAALIGMIPEGLVLLTSTALAITSLKLSRNRMLCQDLYCPEELARVDVLCLDKTGTLTEGKQEISEIETLDKDFDLKSALGMFTSAFKDINSTLRAIKERFGRTDTAKPHRIIPFSSARKFSAAEFDNYGTLVLGAPSFVMRDNAEIFAKAEKYSKKGKRVLLLAYSNDGITDNKLPRTLEPKALIVLTDKLRADATDTLKYFRAQGVKVKIISGDDPRTVSSTALLAELEGAEDYIDMSLISDEQLPEVVEKYTVFGRVTPSRKMEMINALKKANHKTAMIGDGVNDVPALRAADCSAAMYSGSDAARCAARIVLMDSNFSAMPLAVEEGRQCINNIQRSASLFLVKTISSFLLAAIFLFLPLEYPYSPIQMTLVGAVTIGIPSFLLTFEPNRNLVRGSFVSNVMKKAAPPGISLTLGVVLLEISARLFAIPDEKTSTMSVFLMAAICFAALFDVCRPLNMRRTTMIICLISAFLASALLFGSMFLISTLSASELIILLILVLMQLGIMFLLKNIILKVTKER